MRKLYRSIARARLLAMGVDQINKKNHSGKSKMMIGWKRVLWGDLAKDGFEAQFHIGKYAKNKKRRPKAAV